MNPLLVFTSYNLFFLIPLIAPFGGAILGAFLYKITFEVGIKPPAKSDNAFGLARLSLF